MMAVSPDPRLSENAYLFGLPYETLRDLVFADPVESLSLREQLWQRSSEELQDLRDVVVRCLNVVNTYLSGRAAARARQILHSVLARAQHQADQAGHNAVAYRAAAGALTDAQRAMAALGGQLSPPDRQARAATIAYKLAEAYSNLSLRILGPPSVTPESVDDGRYDQYGATAGFGVMAGSALRRPGPAQASQRRPPVPEEAPPPVPTVPEDEDGDGAYPPTVPVQGSSAAPAVPLPAAPFEPPTVVPVAPWLVGRTGLIRVAAWMVTEAILTRNTAARAELPAVLNVWVDGGSEPAGLLHKLRGAIADREQGQGPAPVPVVVSAEDWSVTADVWTALLRVAPQPARRARLLGGRRRQADRGTHGHLALLTSALRIWSEQGKMAVYLVEKLNEVSAPVLDELITAVLALSSGPDAPAAFVLELDPARASARLDEVGGHGAGARRLRLVSSLGFHLPAPSAQDIDLLHTGMGQARAFPVPVWAEAAELDMDGQLWTTISRDLAAQRSLSEAQRASVIWLWRFYLRVLDTAPLSPDAAVHHGQSVYALARVAARWARLQLELPASARLSPASPADARGDTAPSATTLDELAVVDLPARDELIQLREQVNADPSLAALVRQVL